MNLGSVSFTDEFNKNIVFFFYNKSVKGLNFRRKFSDKTTSFGLNKTDNIQTFVPKKGR